MDFENSPKAPAPNFGKFYPDCAFQGRLSIPSQNKLLEVFPAKSRLLWKPFSLKNFFEKLFKISQKTVRDIEKKERKETNRIKFVGL